MLIHLHNPAMVRPWFEDNGEGDDDAEGAGGDPFRCAVLRFSVSHSTSRIDVRLLVMSPDHRAHHGSHPTKIAQKDRPDLAQTVRVFTCPRQQRIAQFN